MLPTWQLEGKGGAYIRDTGGFAKWDTSAPTAVLEAYGNTVWSHKVCGVIPCFVHIV